MTFLFFLFALFIASLAYNLYHPNFSHDKLSVLSFLCGWLVGELALHHIALQLATVFWFTWAGAVDGFIGAVSLVICVVSWLAMTFFHLQGHRAKQAMESGLQQGLGRDYQQSIEPGMREQFPADIDYPKIRKPIKPIPAELEVMKNIRYGSGAQRLDIYRDRVEHSAPRPVLLQIHGGAWTEKMGSKNEQALPLMSHMAQRGWICVAISYRLSPSATFPDHIIDCKEALVWIKKTIASYGGDPDFVVTTGGSAGGHLSSLLALSANDPLFQPGFEDSDTSVQGAVPFYGVYDFSDSEGLHANNGLAQALERSVMKLSLADHSEAYQSASPLHRIGPHAPPFCIIQGDKDSLVPVATARSFAKKLAAESNREVVYAEISGAQHAFDMFPSIRSEHVKQGVERYLVWLYSTYLALAKT